MERRRKFDDDGGRFGVRGRAMILQRVVGRKLRCGGASTSTCTAAAAPI
jgi:hypothetical protein